VNAAWASTWSLTTTVNALPGSAGLAGPQARPAADSVAEGATKIVQGAHEIGSPSRIA
jgi:hypothetical protein